MLKQQEQNYIKNRWKMGVTWFLQ